MNCFSQVYVSACAAATVGAAYSGGQQAAEDDLRALRAQEVQTVDVQGKVLGEPLTVPVVTPEQFDALLMQHAELAAIVLKPEKARHVPLYLGDLRPGAVQAIAQRYLHHGPAVVAGDFRVLLIFLATLRGRMHTGDLATSALQYQSPDILAMLGLLAAMCASKAVVDQVRAPFFLQRAGQGASFLSESTWRQFLDAAACDDADERTTKLQPVRVAVREAHEGRARLAARLDALEAAAAATRGPSQIGQDFGFVSAHSEGLIRVSPMKGLTLKQVGLEDRHVFILDAQAHKEWDYTEEHFRYERAFITQGQLTIECRDTGKSVVINKGGLIEIERGLRCVLKSTGTKRLVKRYAVFDSLGEEILDHDPDADVLTVKLDCDKCRDDVWRRSFKVILADGTVADYCAKCLETLDALTRLCAKEHRFDEEIRTF